MEVGTLVALLLRDCTGNFVRLLMDAMEKCGRMQVELEGIDSGGSKVVQDWFVKFCRASLRMADKKEKDVR